MRKSKQTIIVQTTILTATLFLNTGCLGYLNNSSKVTAETPVVTKPIIPKVVTAPAPTSIIQEQPTKNILANIRVECTDDINSPSSCHKKPVKVQELHPKQIDNQGGEIHQLRSIQGQSITIEERSNGFLFPEHPNKVVILQMFGKNCSHCIKEMPIMRKLYGKYRKKLEIIAVQVEDKMSPREAKRLLQTHRIKYPIVPGDDATNLQYNIQSTYGWTGVLPYTLVIKDGVTEFNYPGEVSFKEINRDLKTLF